MLSHYSTQTSCFLWVTPLKQNTFQGAVTWFRCENKMGMEVVLIIFQGNTYVQPYYSKGLGESFYFDVAIMGLSQKKIKIRNTPVFFCFF